MHPTDSAASTREELEVQALIVAKLLLMIACKLVPNYHLAEDLTQQALLHYWGVIVQGRRLDNPMGFAIRILKNLVVNHYRREGTRPNQVGLIDLESDDNFVANADLQDLFAAILGDRDTELFFDRYIKKMTCVEIATERGIPVGSVQSNIHRSRLKLKSALFDLEDDLDSKV